MKTKLFLVAFTTLSLFTSSFAQEVSSRNEALLLLNLTRYFNWENDQVSFGVLGDTPVLKELEILVEKNPKINLIKINDEIEVDMCDILFIPENQTELFASIQEKIVNSNIVLVTENEKLISKGAEISLFEQDGKLRFAVSRSAMEDSGIKMSTKLLSHAKILD